MRIAALGAGLLIAGYASGMAQSASDQQFGNYSVYGGAVPPAVLPPGERVEAPVPPDYIVDRVRAAGLDPTANPVRIGATYVMRAIDRQKMPVRVVLGAGFGDILSIEPIGASRGQSSRSARSGSDIQRALGRKVRGTEARLHAPGGAVSDHSLAPRPQPAPDFATEDAGHLAVSNHSIEAVPMTSVAPIPAPTTKPITPLPALGPPAAPGDGSRGLGVNTPGPFRPDE